MTATTVADNGASAQHQSLCCGAARCEGHIEQQSRAHRRQCGLITGALQLCSAFADLHANSTTRLSHVNSDVSQYSDCCFIAFFSV